MRLLDYQRLKSIKIYLIDNALAYIVEIQLPKEYKPLKHINYYFRKRLILITTNFEIIFKIILIKFKLDTDKKTKREKKKTNINQTMENGKTTTYAQSTTIY